MAATKQFYHDLDLVKLGQIVNTRLQNVADLSAQDALAATLGVDNTGLIIYRTDEKRIYTWDGAIFVPSAIEVAGDIIFKGMFDASLALDDAGQPQVIEPIAGYQYVVSADGVFNAGASGVVLQGRQELRTGDQILFTSETEAYAIQRNIDAATETVEGKVFLATQAEVNAGASDATNEAVTPATLAGALVANKYVKQFFGTVNVPAGLTGVTVSHGLNLNDSAAFQVNTVDAANNQVSLEVDAVDPNSLRLRSLVALTGVKVTVQGASTTYVGV